MSFRIGLDLGIVMAKGVLFGLVSCVTILPSLILVLFNVAGFLDLMRTAGGLIAIIIAVMVVPAYHNARRDVPENNLLRRSRLPLEIMIVIAYILMAVGSVVPV